MFEELYMRILLLSKMKNNRCFPLFQQLNYICCFVIFTYLSSKSLLQKIQVLRLQERRYYTNLSLFYIDSHSCLPNEINHIPYKTVILEKCERVGVGKSVYQARYNFINIFHKFVFILKPNCLLILVIHCVVSVLNYINC